MSHLGSPSSQEAHNGSTQSGQSIPPRKSQHSTEIENSTQTSFQPTTTEIWSSEFSPEERLRLGLRRYESEEQKQQAYQALIADNENIFGTDLSGMSRINTFESEEESFSSSIIASTGQAAFRNQVFHNQPPNISLLEQDLDYPRGLPTTVLDQSDEIWRLQSYQSSDAEDNLSVDGEEVVEDHPEGNSSQLSEEKSTNRMMNSKKYFDELEALEARVYAQSAVRFYKLSETYSPWAEDGETIVSKIPLPESQKGKVVDEYSVLHLCQETIRGGNKSLALWIWHLLECRAHIEPFDERYLGSKLDGFQIPTAFFREPSLSVTGLNTIRLSRRSLQCLDNFLAGRKVWVFNAFWSFSDNDERLYLVTEVDTFADIWGPLWKECLVGEPQQVIRYKVGHGYIVPWDWDQEINFYQGEVCCHWFAESDVPENASFDKMKMFNGTETLVIGAPYVRPNRDCRCPNKMIKQRLMESGLLQLLATYEASKYVEGETMEIAVGIPAKGLTGKYGRTWKRRDGHPLRLAFLESWEHPELNCLDPAQLEHKYGLEISLATYNARKVPLVRLLGSASMLEYLRPYPWLEADCKTKYIDAVRNKDLKSFRRLWQSNPEWQDDIRKAVCCCLRALSETGVGIKEEMDALYVIWVPAPGQRHLVVLKRRQHNWTGFLKDSRDYFTMAVGAGQCLDFTGDGGKCCSSDGYSVFETALMINEIIKPIQLRKLRMRKYREIQEFCWSVSQLKKGELFTLGDRGALQFIKRVGQGSVLVEWKSIKLRQVVAQVEDSLLGRPHQRHWEHIEDDEELDLPGDSLLENGTASRVVPKIKPLRVYLTAYWN